MDSPKSKEAMPDGLQAELSKFFFDTAQAFHPVTMRALKEAVPVSQIVLGTDWPYRHVAQTMAGVAEKNVFTPAELAAIGGTNMRRLLPHLPA